MSSSVAIRPSLTAPQPRRYESMSPSQSTGNTTYATGSTTCIPSSGDSIPSLASRHQPGVCSCSRWTGLSNQGTHEHLWVRGPWNTNLLDPVVGGIIMDYLKGCVVVQLSVVHMCVGLSHRESPDGLGSFGAAGWWCVALKQGFMKPPDRQFN